MNLPKSLTFLSIFVEVSKYIIFLVKSFLGNFERHLAILFWVIYTNASLNLVKCLKWYQTYLNTS